MVAKRTVAVAAVLLGLGGCSGSGSTGVMRSTTAVIATPTTPAPTTPAPTTARSVPRRPTASTGVPADVPTTGPNVRTGERPPVEPVLARQHSAAGAQAFAVFFVKTIDWGYATVSGTYLRHYAEPSCNSCMILADGMDHDRRAGDQYIGGRITITSAERAPHAGDSHAEIAFLIRFDILSFEQLSRSGAYVTADPAHTAEMFEVALAWQATGWHVVFLGLAE